MSKINIITTDELREMRGSEGLILQGCGGDLTEWVDGISEMLTKEGILLEGTKFDEVHAFKHEGLTNLLFPFSVPVDSVIAQPRIIFVLRLDADSG